MMDNRPAIAKKTVLIGVIVFLLLVGAGVFFSLYHGPSQNIPDDSEPQLNFAADDSKIAGIQKLAEDGWLSWTQYKKVYHELDQSLPEMEPDANYFLLVEESLGMTSVDGEEKYNNVTIEYVPGGDGDEAEFEETTASERNEMEMTDTIFFLMRSNSGTEYVVEIYTGGDLETARIKVEKK